MQLSPRGQKCKKHSRFLVFLICFFVFLMFLRVVCVFLVFLMFCPPAAPLNTTGLQTILPVPESKKFKKTKKPRTLEETSRKRNRQSNNTNKCKCFLHFRFPWRYTRVFLPSGTSARPRERGGRGPPCLRSMRGDVSDKHFHWDGAGIAKVARLGPVGLAALELLQKIPPFATGMVLGKAPCVLGANPALRHAPLRLDGVRGVPVGVHDLALGVVDNLVRRLGARPAFLCAELLHGQHSAPQLSCSSGPARPRIRPRSGRSASRRMPSHAELQEQVEEQALQPLTPPRAVRSASRRRPPHAEVREEGVEEEVLQPLRATGCAHDCKCAGHGPTGSTGGTEREASQGERVAGNGWQHICSQAGPAMHLRDLTCTTCLTSIHAYMHACTHAHIRT